MSEEKRKPFNVVFPYRDEKGMALMGMDIWALDKEDAEYIVRQMATRGRIRDVGFPYFPSCGHRCHECESEFNLDVRSNGAVSVVVSSPRSAEPEKRLSRSQ